GSPFELGSLNSYAPRYTAGTLAPKSSAGGGDGTLHSSVVACQGLRSSTRSPRASVHARLTKKTNCAAVVKSSAIRVTVWTLASMFVDTPPSAETSPNQCIGKKTA